MINTLVSNITFAVYIAVLGIINVDVEADIIFVSGCFYNYVDNVGGGALKLIQRS